MQSTRQLSIVEQQQLVYSSLLRYSPETKSLRDRALDRVVSGALLGSTETQPIQLQKLQEILKLTKNGLCIRESAIQETLQRLKKAGIIKRIEHKKRRAYFLTATGNSQLQETVNAVGDVFDPALAELLQNTSLHFSYEVGAALCRQIILRCFSQLGQKLASNVTGLSESEAYLDRNQILDITSQALESTALSSIAKESISSRILIFFTSRSPAAERLKFHLAQGYYFTQLLGVEASLFNPLAEQSFSGAVFFLDANVILIGILENQDDHASPFAELSRVAKQLGITLIVSRSTITELQNAAEAHITNMEQYLGKLPKELTEQTNDSFVLGYNRLKKESPGFSLDAFRGVFREIDAAIREKWIIDIQDVDMSACLQADQYTAFEAAINYESDIRGPKRKSDTILHHDVLHCLLIQHIRKQNPKAWFLTRDGVLARASTRIGNGSPVCFSFLGFLQSISPFLTSVGDETSLAEILTELLATQIAPQGPIFQPSELAIIAEYHADILATPPEQLVLALDYVRAAELDGHTYNIEHLGRMSLGLRKFLAKSKEDQIRAHKEEHQRLEQAAAQEQAARKKAEQSELAGKMEIETLRREKAEEAKVTANLTAQLDALGKSTVPRGSAAKGVLASAGLLCSVVGLVFRDWIVTAWVGHPSHGLSLGIDCGLLLLALWSATALVPLFASTLEDERRGFWLAVIVPTVVFLLCGNYEAGATRNVIDLITKVTEAAAIVFVANSHRNKSL